MTHAASRGGGSLLFPVTVRKREKKGVVNMKWGQGVTSDKLSAFCLFIESPNPQRATNTLAHNTSLMTTATYRSPARRAGR